MNDNYDLEGHENGEPNEHDAELEHELEHEHEIADDHETKAEAWQDDQPPVDDLMAEDGSGATEVGSETTEENFEGHEGHEGHDEEVTETRKKSGFLLPIVVGLFSLAVLGAVLHWQFSRLPMHAGNVQKTTSPAKIAANSNAGPGTTTTESEVAPKMAMDNSVLAYPSPSSGSATPSSANTAVNGNLVTPQINGGVTATSSSQTASAMPPMPPMPMPTPIPSPRVTDALPAPQAAPVASITPAATPPLPVAPPAPAISQEIIPAPTKTVATPASSTDAKAQAKADAKAEAKVDAKIDARIASLSTRVDELTKALDKANQQLTQAQGQIKAEDQAIHAESHANINLATPSNTAPLEDRLAKVEQQLTQIEHQQKTEATHVTKTAAAPAPTEVASVPDVTPVKPAATEATTKLPAAVVHKPKPKAKVVAKAAAPAKVSSHWVLRAATPDEAWVAKDASTAELHHIQIGDELPGIGRVKSIQQSGDSWSVVGTTGTIH